MATLAAAEAEYSEAEAADIAKLCCDDAASSIPDLLALSFAELADPSAFWRFRDT